MRIKKSILSSQCKDGSMVKEYSLNSPVDDRDIAALKEIGGLQVKNLGGAKLFTFSSDIFTMKGMIGDTCVYVTHKKEHSCVVDEIIHRVFTECTSVGV
jgi:hypothetical protein